MNPFEIAGTTLKKYNGTGKAVIIPDGVKTIGFRAFYSLKNLTKVTIPESVESIEEGAFFGCINLTQIDIPSSVKKIADNSFWGCRALADGNGFIIVRNVLQGYTGYSTVVSVPEGIERIGMQAFSGQYRITTISIPDSVISIGKRAFQGCKSLESISLSHNLKIIDDECFSGLRQLKEINLPEHLEVIGKNAFFNCSGLTYISIPDSVKKVGSGAFYGCTGLADSNGFIILNSVIYGYVGSEKIVTIPKEVTSIGQYSFTGCSSLTHIIIPDNITSIEDYAFMDCQNLVDVKIPETISYIGTGVFRGCKSLKVDNGLVIIQGVLYGYVGDDSIIQIPKGVKYISNRAFFECDKITEITLPEGIIGIGSYAFYGCANLGKITIPQSVTSIEEGTFWGCSSMESVVIPEGVISIGTSAFSGCSNLASVVIPDSVESIGAMAFASCTSLIDITLADSIKNIGREAFADCRSLSSITLPKNLKTIEYATFRYCIKLRNVLLPDSLVSIENVAFRGCNLAHISLPETLASLGAYAFDQCNALENISIPNNVTQIRERTFENCHELSEIILSNNLIRIGECAFNNCERLKKIKLPQSLTVIGDYAFSGCKSLTDVSLPEGCGIEWLAAIDQSATTAEYVEDLRDICQNADEHRMAELIKCSAKWSKQWKDRFYAAYLYSDTKQAILLAEKRKELDRYARMRNMNEDEIRDQTLPDLGLDKQNSKSFDLGNIKVTVRMLSDFSFAVVLPDGKVSSTLPKKNTDPEKYKKAKSELDQMKKDVKSIWRNRAGILLEDFIYGWKRKVDYWSRTYLGNPILHNIASLIVWKQGSQYFTVSGENIVQSNGMLYVLSTELIQVAHPLEMEQVDIIGWQRYFNERRIKQPFAQVWEPVHSKDEIAIDRYRGCSILFFQLHGAIRHGFDEKLDIPGCTIRTVWNSQTTEKGKTTSFCDIVEFKIEKYSRIVNHAIAYLDRLTVLDRIEKDDTSIMDFVEGCTFAQINDYICRALESKAVNVTALLLEYKDQHFKELQPMDSFILEW